MCIQVGSSALLKQERRANGHLGQLWLALLAFWGSRGSAVMDFGFELRTHCTTATVPSPGFIIGSLN